MVGRQREEWRDEKIEKIKKKAASEVHVVPRSIGIHIVSPEMMMAFEDCWRQESITLHFSQQPQQKESRSEGIGIILRRW